MLASNRNFSAFFIQRPIATTLLTAAIVLLGIFAFPLLSVAPLPQAEFPTIRGIKEMTSTSSLGSTRITLQFDLDKKIDTAAHEVQAALNAAAGRLPDDMPSLPYCHSPN